MDICDYGQVVAADRNGWVPKVGLYVRAVRPLAFHPRDRVRIAIAWRCSGVQDTASEESDQQKGGGERPRHAASSHRARARRDQRIPLLVLAT